MTDEQASRSFVRDLQRRRPIDAAVCVSMALATSAVGIYWTEVSKARTYRRRVVKLPPFPIVDSLKSRLVTTREWAQRLTRLKPSRAAIRLIQRAIEDLTDAERLFGLPEAHEKPHILRAVDACIDVAEWRLRGVQQLIDEAAT